MRVLIDSDVCLDFLLQRPAHLPDANSLFANIEMKTCSAYVCAVSLTTIHYIVRKEKDAAAALAAVDGLLVLADVCQVNFAVLQNARALNFKDYEDAVQCASAIAEGLDAIVTRNTKDFANSPIEVYSPADFLAHLHPAEASNE
ncbi:MAG TPA: PIN domain-containing protein [Pyrinomonadaceae bacterium]|nr:PIN domain-containing protein [Pyrinomonadaceae bacterium]